MIRGGDPLPCARPGAAGARLGGLLAVTVLALACSAGPSSTATPTLGTPTATPSNATPAVTEPVIPSAEPTAWDELEGMLTTLGLDSADLGYAIDPPGDGVNNPVEPRSLQPDLDIVRTFVGWVILDAGAFGPGGLFDCADSTVICAPDGAERHPGFADGEYFLAAVQMAGPIQLAGSRGAEITVAVDRLDHENAPADFDEGGYAGADMVEVAHLDIADGLSLYFDPQAVDWPSSTLDGPVRIEGDTALFFVPVMADQQPAVKFVSQWEQGQFDFAPAGEFREVDNVLLPAP